MKYMDNKNWNDYAVGSKETIVIILTKQEGTKAECEILTHFDSSTLETMLLFCLKNLKDNSSPSPTK